MTQEALRPMEVSLTLSRLIASQSTKIHELIDEIERSEGRHADALDLILDQECKTKEILLDCLELILALE
jgi:hypothetical protein